LRASRAALPFGFQFAGLGGVLAEDESTGDEADEEKRR
jgi:hypothetical protein